MFLTVIFLISGVALTILIGAKYLEERRNKTFLILELISKGDLHVRDFSHKAAHNYAEFREWAEFFVKKQLPLHSKSLLNKSHTLVQDKSAKYLELIRDSKLLKKSDGISEFFKTIGDVEKGNGEIDGYSEELLNKELRITNKEEE